MSYGPGSVFDIVSQRPDAAILDLGPGNQGNLGPTQEDLRHLPRLLGAALAGTYRRLPNGVWVCMDGRGVSGEGTPDGLYAPGQMPGNLVGTNTSGDMMDKDLPAPFLSERTLYNTRVETSDDSAYRKRLIFHGDDHGSHQEEDGCADNREKRNVLTHGAENADAIAPIAWRLGSAIGVAEYGVDIDYVQEALVIGGERAADKRLWDASPRDVVEIAKAFGAEYVTLTGKHREVTGIATMDGQTYGSREFARDNCYAAGDESQVFGLTFGLYAQTTFNDAIRRGQNPEQAAKKVMRGLIHPVVLFKYAGNTALDIIQLGIEKPVRLALPQS